MMREIIKEVMISLTENETIVCVTEDQQLVEVFFEEEKKRSTLGNFYLGKVENVLPGMQAAFVDINEAKNGFLYISDAVPKVMDAEGTVLEPTQTIDQALKKNQTVLVQVMKEPVGTKGARLTTHPTIPGRFAVLMPTVGYIGISRRIEEPEERQRLLGLAQAILKDNMGVILRTAAKGVSKEEIDKDIKILIKYWRRVQQKAIKATAPSILYKDHTLLERMVRDIFTEDIRRIYVNSLECKERLEELFLDMLPELASKIQIVATADIMTLHDLSNQIERALKPKVWLRSGGYLVIEHTEALTVIDVNTGKFVGDRNLASTVLQTNLEAAAEIAKQIRLRNIGGIIIVDFIDMKEEQDKEQILATLGREMKKDRVKTNILGLTQLGLLEMTRKKSGQLIGDILLQNCPFCGGNGKISLDQYLYLSLKNELIALAMDTTAPGIYVEVNPVIAAHMIGLGGGNLELLEKQINKKLVIKGNKELKLMDKIIRPYYETDQFAGVVPPVTLEEELEVYVESLQTENIVDGIARINGFVILIENGGKFMGKRVPIKITELFKTYAKACLL